MFEKNKLKTTNNISSKKKLPKQLDKILLTKADTILFSKPEKKILISNKIIVFDCLDKKNWNDIKDGLDLTIANKMVLFGVLLHEFNCNKNSDLKLFSKLKLSFPLLKIIYRIDEKNIRLETLQSAIDLGFDFVYLNEENVPKKVIVLLEKLHPRNNHKVDNDHQTQFLELRKKIDKIDTELLELLSKRNKAIQNIGKIKSENNLKIFQSKRWETILNESFKDAKKYGIHKDELKKILEAIHIDAIKTQLKIYSKTAKKKS
jgi:chorismate mutase